MSSHKEASASTGPELEVAGDFDRAGIRSAAPSPSPVGVDAMREALEPFANAINKVIANSNRPRWRDRILDDLTPEHFLAAVAALASAPQSVPAGTETVPIVSDARTQAEIILDLLGIYGADDSKSYPLKRGIVETALTKFTAAGTRDDGIEAVARRVTASVVQFQRGLGDRLSIYEAVFDALKSQPAPAGRDCEWCQGSGQDRNMPCPVCDRKGVLPTAPNAPAGTDHTPQSDYAALQEVLNEAQKQIGEVHDRVARAHAAGIEAAARCIPTTWLDDLLSSPSAPKVPMDCPGVEKLLRGIQERIRSLSPSRAGDAPAHPPVRAALESALTELERLLFNQPSETTHEVIAQIKAVIK